MIEYKQLEPSYRYDVIAQAIYAREVEYFHYDFDRVNFEYMLSKLPEGAYRADIESRLVDTKAQMANVKLIIEALEAQIADPAEYQAAVGRMAAKRKEQEK